jgi:hypothetical protein
MRDTVAAGEFNIAADRVKVSIVEQSRFIELACKFTKSSHWVRFPSRITFDITGPGVSVPKT